MYHYSLKRCSICGEVYQSDEEVWEIVAKEEYSFIPGKFPGGVVHVRAHTTCWKAQGDSH